MGRSHHRAMSLSSSGHTSWFDFLGCPGCNLSNCRIDRMSWISCSLDHIFDCGCRFDWAHTRSPHLRCHCQRYCNCFFLGVGSRSTANNCPQTRLVPRISPQKLKRRRPRSAESCWTPCCERAYRTTLVNMLCVSMLCRYCDHVDDASSNTNYDTRHATQSTKHETQF